MSCRPEPRSPTSGVSGPVRTARDAAERRPDQSAEVADEDDVEYEDPPPSRRDRMKAWGPLAVVLLVLGGFASVIFAGLVLMAPKPVRAPDFANGSCNADDSHKVLVEVKRGATGLAIGAALYQADVVKSAQAFVDAAGHEKAARDIGAGAYHVCTRISGAAAVRELLKVSNLDDASTIEVKPGQYSWETVRSLAAKRGWSRAEVQAVIDANLIGLPAWAKSDDGRWSAEGMFEPGRYMMDREDTPQNVLTDMVRARTAFLASVGLEAKAADLMCAPSKNCTPEQVLTIASMAEAEVTHADPDGREVSEAVQNRLRQGDHLGVDATTRYWLSLKAGKRVEVTKRQVDDPADPYATGGHKGLPPTPVSIPSKEMIAAVLHPTTDGWFYWCVTEGGTKFFKGTQKTEFERACLRKH
jgi:UPF0755 protein